MYLFKKRHSSKHKRILKHNENLLQNRYKILKFNKQKWQILKEKFLSKIKKKIFHRTIKQGFYSVSSFPLKSNSFKKNFKATLKSTQILKIIYGNIRKNKLKKEFYDAKKMSKIPTNTHRNWFVSFLKNLESRLDVVLYKARFSPTIESARQLIAHKGILVNNIISSNISRKLKKGDIIGVEEKTFSNISTFLIVSNTKNMYCSYPPQHLTINYKTLQIVFGEIEKIDIFNLKTNELYLENFNVKI